MKTFRHTMVAVAVAASTTAALSGCGSNAAAETDGGKKASSAASLDGKRVADIANVPNAFTTCLQDNYLPAIKKAGADSFTVFGKFDPKTFQQVVEDSIAKAPDTALILSEFPALDSLAIKQLKTANIKSVLALADPEDGTTPDATLAFDYEHNASISVDELKRSSPDIKRVGIIDGIPGTPSTDVSTKELKSALADAGISVEGVLQSQYTSQGGATATQDLIQSHPDVQAIFVYGDDASLAATRSISAAGKDIPVIGFFSSAKAAVEQVRSGKILFLLQEPVAKWAEQITTAIEAVTAGKKVDKQFLEMELLNKDSAADATGTC